MEYLPYGETWFEEGDGNNAPKYNSQELDKETGYYFYNARHYDPEISRFVTPDTVIDGEYDTQGWNRYSYVKGNPVRYRDPTGHDVFDIVSKAIDKAVDAFKSASNYLENKFIDMAMKDGLARAKERDKIKNALRGSKDSSKTRFGAGITLKAQYSGNVLKDNIEGGEPEAILVYKNTPANRKGIGEPEKLGKLVYKKGEYVVVNDSGKTVGTLEEIRQRAKAEEEEYAAASLLISIGTDAVPVFKSLKGKKMKEIMMIYVKEELSPKDLNKLNSLEKGKSTMDYVKDITPVYGSVRALKNYLRTINWDEKSFHNEHLLQHVK